jgi:intein/homing endonuclease
VRTDSSVFQNRYCASAQTVTCKKMVIGNDRGTNDTRKKLKLYINNKPYANLELQDVTASQSFKIDPIQSTDSTKDLVLTFEVIEIYKGTKYGDLAISEINFDGLDVHCFAAGTSILMADKTEKNIELIKSGDSILTFDKQTNQLSKTVVIRLVTARHSNLVKLTFDDREIIVTDDHPFFTDNKQWASVNSDKSNNFYLQDKLVSQLSVDMNVFIPSDNKFIRLKSIEHLAGEQLTYTIEIASGDSFIANGLLVKTENVKWTN